jgi:hypothetical protein
MYENTKYNSRITLAYTFVFILRRLIFISIGMLVNDHTRGGVQIIGILIINLAFSIYIAISKAQKKFMLNFTEFFNEIIVQFTTI